MARQQGSCCQTEVMLAVQLGVYIAVVVVLWGTIAYHAATSSGPVYSVAVTGVDGLDPAAADASASDRPAATLTPVFSLAFRIDNARDAWSRACVPKFSAAVVSYGDAFLARGSVPQFCAEGEEVRERGATAWGQDVAVPRFLRDQLAGELERGEVAVDVQVTMPASCDQCADKVLVCKAKIGGGPSPCQLTRVYHQRPAVPYRFR